MDRNSNGCFGSFGASASLKIIFSTMVAPNHNISQSFWKARQMVWGSSVPAAPVPGILRFTDCFAIQSGVTFGLSSHMSLPFHRIQIWDGKCFLKSSLLEQGLSCTWDTMGILPSPEESLDDVSMAGADERRAREDLPEMFLRVWAIKILLSCSQQWVFHHHIQWCAFQDLPTSHPTVQTWSVFSQCHPARLLSH